MSGHESNIMAGAFRLLEKHIDDRHKGCGDCKRLYWQLLRAITMWLDNEGKSPVFSNNGKSIDELDGKEPYHPYDCIRCHTIIAEMDARVKGTDGWRHKFCPDTPETVATKAKQARNIGEEALRIFGRKK